MQLYLVLFAALAPVLVLLFYIYRKDSVQPEPSGWLLKAFLLGVGSVILSMLISGPLASFLEFQIESDVYPSVLAAFMDAFLLAAIPEEFAKLFMLWLLLRKNPYFDEHFDGIVYAVFVGMGFAGLENVMYVFEGIEDGTWFNVGITRALFSVPGHFLFAVLMGYYYSLFHFGISRNFLTMLLIPGAPILAHGIFDGLLFSFSVNETVALVGCLVFLFFFIYLAKIGRKKIQHLLGN